MAGLLSIDTASLEDFAARLRAASDTFGAAVIAKRQEAAEMVAAAVHTRASTFSAKTAAGIRIVPVDENTTAVRSTALLGRLNEKGNKGSSAGASAWSHPVFGNRSAWATNRMHPFFRVTYLATRSRVQALMAEAPAAAIEEVQA